MIALALLLVLLNGCASQVQISGRSAPVTLALRPAAERETFGLPAHLVVEQSRFEDADGNQTLDAEEEGSLLIRVRNDGLGPANLSVHLTPLTDMTAVEYPRTLPETALSVGEARTVRIPFVAAADVADAQRELRVEVTETLSSSTTPFVLSFASRAVVEPEFRVIVRDVKDGSFFAGNTPDGRIEAGEMVKVTANVQNVGGPATGVTVEVEPDASADVRYTRDLQGNPDNLFLLGELGPGENRDIEFYFFTTPLFAAEELRFHLDIDETRPRFGVETGLTFEIGKPVEREHVLAAASVTRGGTAGAGATAAEIAFEASAREPSPHGMAVIFGVEDYRYTFDAVYKAHDAVAFYRFCRDVLGIPEDRILLRTDADATKAEFDYVFEPPSSSRQGWLKKRLRDPAEAAQTDLLVFVGGHGFPDVATGQPYLIPHDVRPEQTTNGVSLPRLYESLGSFGLRSVTVFVESCFSGASGYDRTGGERQLALRMNPVLPVTEKAVVAENTVVFAASRGTEPSSNRDDLRHGIFTHCALQGLAGAADADADADVDVTELYAYLARAVPALALAPPLDREQHPQLLPAPGRLGRRARRVLVRY